MPETIALHFVRVRLGVRVKRPLVVGAMYIPRRQAAGQQIVSLSI